MDNRVWASGAAASPPTAPASPSVGYPSPGDPLTATPASKGGAFWFHQLGEELRAIQTAAGITPDHEDLTQLLTALRSAGVFTTPSLGDRTTKAATMACFSQEFSVSLAGSGYQKLPSGLIVQWGAVSTSASADVTLTFPIAFPTSALCAVAVPVSGTGTTVAMMACTAALNATGVNVANYLTNGARVSDIARVIAIGY